MYMILQNSVHLKCRTLIKPLENSIFSHFVYYQAEKTICFMWHFNGLSCHSCRLCTGLILDPAFKLDWFCCQCPKIGFQRTFYVPPLLKSLSTRATNPIRNLVLISKSEQFCSLGAGLKGSRTILDALGTLLIVPE